MPIFEAPPLARALHRNVEIGGEIPSNLYVAVAQVLTYIYQVKSARRSGLCGRSDLLSIRDSIPDSHRA